MINRNTSLDIHGQYGNTEPGFGGQGHGYGEGLITVIDGGYGHGDPNTEMSSTKRCYGYGYGKEANSVFTFFNISDLTLPRLENDRLFML